jgi:hypothetical protein
MLPCLPPDTVFSTCFAITHSPRPVAFPPLTPPPTARTVAPSATASHRISRFPYEKLACVLGVLDRTGSDYLSRLRGSPCCLPHCLMASAPWINGFSRLNMLTVRFGQLTVRRLTLLKIRSLVGCSRLIPFNLTAYGLSARCPTLKAVCYHTTTKDSLPDGWPTFRGGSHTRLIIRPCPAALCKWVFGFMKFSIIPMITFLVQGKRKYQSLHSGTLYIPNQRQLWSIVSAGKPWVHQSVYHNSYNHFQATIYFPWLYTF